MLVIVCPTTLFRMVGSVGSLGKTDTTTDTRGSKNMELQESRAEPGPRVPQTSTRTTVLLPCGDVTQFLTQALHSCLDQTRPPASIVIIDDTTTASSRGVVGATARLSDAITVVPNRGRGLVDALNTALALVETPYVARMDADDICVSTRFAQQEDYLDRHAAVVAVGGLIRYVDEAGRALPRIPWTSQGFPLSPESVSIALAHTNGVFHPTAMMRTDALKAVGGYRSTYAHVEDYDLWLRLQALGDIANLDEELLFYRRHGDQIGERHAATQAEQVARLHREFDGGRWASPTSPHPPALAAVSMSGIIPPHVTASLVLDLARSTPLPLSLFLDPCPAWNTSDVRSVRIAGLRRGLTDVTVCHAGDDSLAAQLTWSGRLAESCKILDMHFNQAGCVSKVTAQGLLACLFTDAPQSPPGHEGDDSLWRRLRGRISRRASDSCCTRRIHADPESWRSTHSITHP